VRLGIGGTSLCNFIGGRGRGRVLLGAGLVMMGFLPFPVILDVLVRDRVVRSAQKTDVAA
jgi:hypothetical protein